MTINSFTEQYSPPLVYSPNVTFSPQMTSSPKSMARNLLEGNYYCSFSISKSSAKFNANFGIFLHRKYELKAEIEELLCLENDNSVQPATLKLRAIDLRDRFTSLGVASWINSYLDQIDPIGLSKWEDQVCKDITRVR